MHELSDKPNAQSDLDALVEEIVDGFPPLTADEKRELGSLLAPSAGLPPAPLRAAA
jgi:hypothetical protein